MEKFMSVCPYCGSGCKLNLLVENDRIVGAEPLDGVTNEGELCLKGYYGWDFVNDTKILTPRLKHPMIRRRRDAEFEVVSWDEAIAFASSRLAAIKAEHGPDSIMLTGSSRGTGNESNYVMQKFARAVIGTNNVDCCARVCHGPSVSGLMVTLGNGAMSNSICEIEDTKCLLVFGYNAADSHPIVARRIIKAKEKGAKIIVCDPRHVETARISDLWLPLKNGSNMALVNAFANVLIEEGLYNKEYVAQYTEGFDEYRAMVAKYTPEYVEIDHRAAGRANSRGHASLRGGAFGHHPLGHGRDAMGASGRCREGTVRARAADRQSRAAQCRGWSGARTEQRAGRLRHGCAAERVPGVRLRRRSGCS